MPEGPVDSDLRSSGLRVPERKLSPFLPEVGLFSGIKLEDVLAMLEDQEFVAKLRLRPLGRSDIVELRDYWSPRIIELARKPDDLHSMDPRAFEELVATLVDRDGFRVKLTPQSKDGGYDIIAYSQDQFAEYMHLIEVKRYRPDRPVQVGIIRALHGVMESEGADRGMLVTTSRFTSGAESYSQVVRRRIALRDFDLVSEWIQKQARLLRGALQ